MKLREKKMLVLLLTMLLIILAIPFAAFGEVQEPTSNSVSIPVTVTWNHGENAEENRPTIVRLTLNLDGKPVATATATAENNWTSAFTVPSLSAGAYTVTQDAIEDYDTTEGTVKIGTKEVNDGEEIVLSGGTQKFTPASKSTYNLSGVVTVLKKGGEYVIWSAIPIDESKKAEVASALDATVSGNLTKNNVFVSGTPWSAAGGDVSIYKDNGQLKITFNSTSVWSVFWDANSSIKDTTHTELSVESGATVVNTFKTTPPEDDPKDPTDEPKDPTDEPKDPTDEPKDPTDEPKDPTDEPKDPTDEPKDPEPSGPIDVPYVPAPVEDPVVIEDEDTPLEDTPVVEPEEDDDEEILQEDDGNVENDIDIDDEDVALSEEPISTVPRTGDCNSILMWMLVAVVALFSSLALATTKKEN